MVNPVASVRVRNAASRRLSPPAEVDMKMSYVGRMATAFSEGWGQAKSIVPDAPAPDTAVGADAKAGLKVFAAVPIVNWLASPPDAGALMAFPFAARTVGKTMMS